MIEATAAYKAAITGDARRILLRAVIEIIDPDIVLGEPTSSGFADVSKPKQLSDKVFAIDSKYITLEPNRWLLNDDFTTVPEDGQPAGQIAGVNNNLSGDDGVFQAEEWMELPFSNVSILQACSVFFPNNEFDGVPSDFVVEIMEGGVSRFSKQFVGNTADRVALTGFTVNYPDAIRITVNKWSMPGRRMRIAEILPGVYEEWDNDIIAEFDIKQQGDVSCLSLPYGTCTLRMDNLDRRFEPRNKSGIIKTIEERQGIDVAIGVSLPDGTPEYKRVGVFYQFSGGWKTGDNGLSMQWNLVDIIGLIAERVFIVPATLPTTLEGWVAAVVAQLGTNFVDKYIIDPSYASAPVIANSADDIAGLTCGDILRYACMASGTWPRADAETGKLAAEPFWSQGNSLTLDNMNTYPTMKANNDIGAILFTLADGNDTQYVVSGTSAASSNAPSVRNPFIHTAEQALRAARLILSTYGGNRMEITGRGDMSSEIGDVDTVELDESSATTGRRIYQTFTFQNGVLQGCQSVLLQADGMFMFEDYEIITTDGTWTAPSGVSQLRLIIGGGGAGGTDGMAGTFDDEGESGVDGLGGYIWYGTIDINESQSFDVTIGTGGTKGQNGTHSTFGIYSSANGEVYESGFTDVATGSAYGRPGIKTPLKNSSDGGAGGKGGNQGKSHKETIDGFQWTIVDVYPGPGEPGKPGASGFVAVYWDK